MLKFSMIRMLFIHFCSLQHNRVPTKMPFTNMASVSMMAASQRVSAEPVEPSVANFAPRRK